LIMDTSSVLSEGSAYTAHDVLPQLPGFRSNRNISSNRSSSMKYHEGQRFVVDSPASIVSSKKMISDSASTGFNVGTGSPIHSVGLPKKIFKPESASAVLKFHAFFKEAVHESPLENFRVHKCDIFYYTEDDSIQITERKFENSGMPQGNFMKRHQVPKDADSFYSLNDIVIGNTVVFYGRTFQVVGANETTLKYIGQEVGTASFTETADDGASIFPEDNYEAERAMNTWDPTVRYNVKKNPTSVFAEAMLGKTVDNSGRAGFLKYDRKVLRFVCIWDDRESLYGDVQQFKLHYFVADDTIEVLAVFGQNSGRDPAPMLVKRSKVPKDIKDETAGTYHWSDLDVGKVINVFTRPLVLVDADESTRVFFESQGHPLQSSIPVAEEEPPPFEREVPPPTGFGSEEDSLTSCVGSLVQHPPKKVMGENKVLRFLSKFVTGKAEDSGREFVISYFVQNKTISIHEPPKRNSGIVGGPFLKRLPAKDLSEGETLITEASFYVGATIAIGGHLFCVTDTDSGTLDYMEEHSEVFAFSDFPLVMERAAKSLGDSTDNGSFERACVDASPDSVNLSAEGFKAVMDFFDLATPEQQCITVFRNLNEGGMVKISSLIEELKG